MLKKGQDQNDGKQDCRKADARVLGQILAAQNILFVLPDTARIAEFFTQALVSIPGVTACRVCLGGVSVQVGLDSDVCRECDDLRKVAGEPNLMPAGFKCRLAEERDIRIITLEIYEHTFGFFVFRTDTTGVFESYRPFINNLANYIALSLESRLQKNLLQNSEEKFRDIFIESPLGIETYDSSGKLLDANKACLDIFGVADIEEVKEFKLFEDPSISDAVKKKLLEGHTIRYEAPFDFEKVKESHLYKTSKSGTVHLDVLITPMVMKEAVGQVSYLVQVQDITARKRAEDELKKYQENLEEIVRERTAELTATNKLLYQEIDERKRAEENLVQESTERKQAQVELDRVNRVLRMLSYTNQALIHIIDEMKLLSEVCRIAVEVGGYRMAWVAYAEQDEARTLRPMAGAGFDSGYIESARLTWADDECGRGPSGTAIRTGKLCLARNIHADPSFAPWREEALRRGYQASISLPLVSEGRAFGVLSIYAAEPDAFDDNETEILNELASDLAFGVTAIRMWAERERADKQLQTQHALLTSIINSSRNIIIFSLDKNYSYTAFNEKHREEMKKVWDADIEVGMNLLECMKMPELRELAKQSMDRALQGETFTEVQHQPGLDIYHELFWNPVVQNGSIIGATVFTHDITENLQAAEELKRVSLQNEMVLNSAGEGIFGLDMGGSVTFVNPSAANILGYQTDELLNCRSHETFHYQKADGTPHLAEECPIYIAVAAGVPYREEEDVFQRKDATSIPVEYVITPMLENNKIVGGVVVFADITERRRAEQALYASEEGFKEAQHLAQIGSWDWDAIADTIYWSDEYYRVFGFEIGSPPIGYEEHLKAYTPESIERLDAVVKKAMEDGTPYELDLELAQPTSTTRWISARGEAKRDADGKIVGLRGTAQNITYRKQSEEAVRQSEEDYRTLFEDSKDTVIMTSPAGEILDINAAGIELLGYGSKEELTQLNIAEAVYAHPEDRKKMLDNLQRQGYLKNYDLDFQTRDGKDLYLSASLTSMLNNDGEIVAIRGILHDMTEHQRLEEQLRQSQKLESIGLLAGGVAHDFNNYLTAIEGYTDLAMLDLSKESSAYKELQEARRSSDRAANLARQLLLFSRREPMHPKPVSLNTVITDLLKMLRRLIGEQYRLVTNLEDELWTINADASHIEQVIMNLVVNARDAMPGGGEISIRSENFPVNGEYVKTHSVSQPGEFVRLQIEDSGCGMDAETVSHIFDPFFTTKAAAYGTGLGLSVVYGIITQHGGWIDVESSTGRGTIFSIFLPALPLQLGADVTENIPVKQIQGHGERILLVEDEGVVRELVEKMLARSGYSVTVAVDAEEAMAIFKRQQGDFDLVFSDVILPKVNGIALVDHLLEEKPELKVLLASGYSDIGGQEAIHDRGYPFLQKPYQLQTLLKQIKQLLESPLNPA